MSNYDRGAFADAKFKIDDEVITDTEARTWVVRNVMKADGKYIYFMKESSEAFREEDLRAAYVPTKSVEASNEKIFAERKEDIDKQIQKLYDERAQIIKYLKAKQQLKEAGEALGL